MLKTASPATKRAHTKTKARRAARRLVGGEFFVLPALVTPGEAAAIKNLLPAEFDRDADSVDGGATHEFYLEKSGGIDDTLATLPGKPDARADVRARRRPAREALAALTRPIVRERILPFIDDQYVLPPPPPVNTVALGGMEGHREHVGGTRGCGFHGCDVCWSFVRRYRDGERRTHEMHFDVHALVTVVVSLSSSGVDFDGGIYLSTGRRDGRRAVGSAKRNRDGTTIRAARHFLPLQVGDALVHQSDLLHGVHVTRGERWSWVLWLKDRKLPRNWAGAPSKSPFGGCAGLTSHWSKKSAAHGDAVSMFLQARRLQAEAEKKALSEFAPTRNEAKAMRGQRLKLLRGSADKGFTRAYSEYGIAAWEHAVDGSIRFGHARDDLLRDARIYFEAGAYNNEADALYNLGKFYLEQGYDKHLDPTSVYIERAADKDGEGGEDGGRGQGGKENIRVDGVREAVLMFARAAGEGSTLAMFNLGVAYLKGAAGLPQSAEESRRWFEKCGTPDALHALAKTYWDAFQDAGGVDADHAYVRALRRAAEWGSEEAHTDLRNVVTVVARRAGDGGEQGDDGRDVGEL